MPDISSLYPQPPAPPQPFNPMQALDMIGKLNALQQFQAHRAVGEETQRATKDGVFDPRSFFGGTAARPDAALAMPEAVSRGLAQQATQFDVNAAQAKTLADIFGSHADNTSPDAPYHAAAQAARAGVPAPMINDFMAKSYNSPGGYPEAMKRARNIAIGSEGTSQGVDIVDPATGKPMRVPKGALNLGPTAIQSRLAPNEEQSVKQMQADTDRAKNFGQEMFPWEEALSAADKLESKYGKGYFAPGSKGRQEFQSFFYGVSPTVAKWLGGDEEKLKDYAKADKYLTQAVQSRAGSFGVHTDQGLATTISGSPNVSVNDLAVKDVIKASIALRRAEHIQALTSAQEGGPKYSETSAKWPATHDIRALTLDKLDPAAREKLLGSLTKGSPEYQKFNRTLREAYDTGVMTRPQRAAPVGPTPVKTISVTRPASLNPPLLGQ